MFGLFRRSAEPVVPEAAPQPDPVRAAKPLPKMISVPVEDIYDPRPSVVRAIEAAKAKRSKWMASHKVAAKVVAWLRQNDWHTYPYLSADLDEQILYWCSENGVFCPDLQEVREYIPGEANHVRHRKERLNRNNPRHQFLIQRLESKGASEPRGGWRRWVYYIDDVPAVSRAGPREDSARPAQNRPKAKARPDLHRESRLPERDDVTPAARNVPDHAWDDFVIGEEIEPMRRYA